MADFNVRKEMPGVELSKDEFRKRYSERFSDPVFAPLRAEINRILEAAWQAYSESRKAPHTRRAGPGFADPDYRAFGRLDRRKRADQGRRTPAKRSGRAVAHPADQRRKPQRAHLPRRIVKDLAAGDDGARNLRARAAARGRGPRSQPADLRIRPHDPSVQDLRLDRDAALPLAVLLLSQPRARPGAGLDERHLRDVGGGARRDDHLPGELVRAAIRLEAHDRPPGLRRRRQSRSDLDPRQEGRRGEGAGARRLALSAASRRPRVLGGRAWRLRRRRSVHDAIADWLRGQRPDRSRTSVAARARSSATCSPMPPATTISTATPRSRKRCATPRARWSRR